MPNVLYGSAGFDPDRCDGCMSLKRARPAAALRIRAGQAPKIENWRIDCGERVRICPKGAVVPLTDRRANPSKSECTELRLPKEQDRNLA